MSIRKGITVEWRKMRIEYLYGLYSSPNIIRVMKLRRMILKGHTAGTVEGKGEVHTGFWWGDLRDRNRLEDVDVEEMIILKLIGLFDVAQDKERW